MTTDGREAEHAGRLGPHPPLSGRILRGRQAAWPTSRWATPRIGGAGSPGRKKDGGQGLADNTARKRCAFAKQFFADAVKRRLIAENPFGEMKGLSARENRARDYFVTRDEAEAVLAACPDSQWKLLFALSRYGGLRCPSEHLALTWGDVDWDARQNHCAKPQDGAPRREGVAASCRCSLSCGRTCKPCWTNCSSDFDPKAKRLSEQPIITRYRDSNANLRTQLLRIIAKARAEAVAQAVPESCGRRGRRNWRRSIPAHVAADWLGHSIADCRQALLANDRRATSTGHSALHHALQQSTETGESDGNERNVENEKPLDVDNSSRIVQTESGGHGTRTRNPLRGTTFPVWPLAIRLPSEDTNLTLIVTPFASMSTLSRLRRILAHWYLNWYLSPIAARRPRPRRIAST